MMPSLTSNVRLFEIKLGIDLLKFLVKDSLSAVAERCMSYIVTQGDSLDQVDVKIQSTADRGSDIVNIDNVL